ncbi:MAG TPA: peptide chain release factor 1, partial [Candidatus Limnocylindria bacterium]|nr:peptide chain release factor 1 [Candidatus Limnocylindria bacterium]
MIDRLREIASRYEEVAGLLSTPEVGSDPSLLEQYGRELARLEPVVTAFRAWTDVGEQLSAARDMAHDPDEEVRAMAREEVALLESREAALSDELRTLLIPSDPNDERNVILEVRAGAGGEEAALFAADLFRMYARYAERHRWKVELLSSSESEAGGFKEAIAEVRGAGAYSRLKYESGVHRVQRVPVTEASGRIHTSTATVSVLPEADEVDIDIPEKDLRIDVYRSSGPGGQSVNTTDSAVRITHLPTGLVVSQQDQKSQLQNKIKAMEVLRARLLDRMIAEQETARARDRRAMVGTGDRSAKIRTYNCPQSRITDHRINLSVYNLADVLDGDLDELIDALRMAGRQELEH